MHRRAVITNAKFVYTRQRSRLRGLLRYFQFRNDKDSASHVRQFDEQGQRVERWVDRGLGDDHRTILHNCLDLATTDLPQNVSARLLVIAPEVHFMAAIDPERRLDVLRELTEATVENWFEHLNLPTPEYAYVCHEAQPSDLRPDGQTKDEAHLSDSYLHSHVVLAATVPGLEQPREVYKIYEKQLRTLHEAGREALEQIWERELGAERVAELNQELEERTQRYLELDTAQGRDTSEITLPEPPTLDRELELELGE
jgi:hypothetical protein